MAGEKLFVGVEPASRREFLSRKLRQAVQIGKGPEKCHRLYKEGSGSADRIGSEIGKDSMNRDRV